MQDDDLVQDSASKYPEKAIPVLDQGFVRLVDVMGDDAAVVQAARVSYGRGTKTPSQDAGLIRYLMRHRHTTPFEMVEFKFHCKLPIFVARQWIRHRTANVNELSARYSEVEDCFYAPKVEVCTTQSAQNKQGGTGVQIEDAQEFVSSFSDTQAYLYKQYDKLLAAGTRRELARINLPLSMYTEWYWKIDLHNLFHFLSLRLDLHAQYEIRVFAEAIAEIVKERVPLSWSAFEDYRLNACAFSGPELKLLGKLLAEQNLEDTEIEDGLPTKRERREFLDKLARIRSNANTNDFARASEKAE